MSQKTLFCLAGCLMFFAGAAYAQRGERAAAPAPKPDNPQSRAHIEAAHKIAGADAFLMNPYNFF
jgi:hypothetical protein